MLYKSSRFGFSSARALVLLTLGAAVSSACVGEEAAPAPTPLPEPVSASRPPPPISGGTLLVTADGKTAVAADSDRDRVLIVDITTKSVAGQIALQQGDEPGRVIEGAAGRVYVGLRRAGAVITIDLAQKQIVARNEVCSAPRGMAYQDGKLHVACASGELVTLDASSDTEVRRLKLGQDLRDVVVQGADLLVSRFRSADVLRVGSDGSILETQKPTAVDPFFGFIGESAVAWKMVALPTGGVGVVHQSGRTEPVQPDKGGYGSGGPCGGGGIVNSFVSFGGEVSGNPLVSGFSLSQAALPVDLAFSADGSKMTVIAAGSHNVLDMDTALYRGMGGEPCNPNPPRHFDAGQPVAVAYADQVRVVQTRQPARLVVGDADIIELGGESVYDTGHAIFHEAANEASGMACASCHPEGHEDGRVWNFADVGMRRTQSIAGGILATAPFHWAGDLNGFDSLMNDVFTGRMSGPELDPAKKLAVARWIDSIPNVTVSAVADVSAVERGKAIFETDAQAACAKCHSGSLLTNNQSVFVGTKETLQVPSLRGLAARAPFMHDGCAKTLEERFTNTSCGGGDAHGRTSHLSSTQIADLVTYLETL